MTVRIIKKDVEEIGIYSLIDEMKNNPEINRCGAIFSFEGIVRGEETGKTTVKLDLTTPDITETENELKEIVSDVKKKYGVMEIAVVHYIGNFIPGDPLFLTVVAGPHRNESRKALNEIIERVKYELDFKKEEHTKDGTNIIMSGG